MSLKPRAAFVVNPLPQGGSNKHDRIRGAVSLKEGSVILVGVTSGDTMGTNRGSGDFAAVELDTNGTVQWRWQVMRASLLNSTLFNFPKIYILKKKMKHQKVPCPPKYIFYCGGGVDNVTIDVYSSRCLRECGGALLMLP